MTNMGDQIVNNVILYLFKQLYEAGMTILGNNVPSDFYLAFAFLAAMTIPAFSIVVFYAFRRGILAVLIFLWILFIIAVASYKR